MRYVRIEHMRQGCGIHMTGEELTSDFVRAPDDVPWQFGQKFLPGWRLGIPSDFDETGYRFAIREDLFFEYFSPERLAYLRWEAYIVRTFENVDHVYEDGQALLVPTRLVEGAQCTLTEYLEMRWSVAA